MLQKRLAEKKALQHAAPAAPVAAAAVAASEPQSQKPAATRIRKSMRDSGNANINAAPGPNKSTGMASTLRQKFSLSTGTFRPNSLALAVHQ